MGLAYRRGNGFAYLRLIINPLYVYPLFLVAPRLCRLFLLICYLLVLFLSFFIMNPKTAETIKKIWTVVKQIIEIIIIAIAGGSLLPQ